MSRAIGRCVFLVAALLGLLGSGAGASGLAVASALAAEQGPLDPREIALTPADLPDGFVVDPATSGIGLLPDSAGVTYRVDMKREASAQALLEGPIIVQQIVVRVDAPIPAEDVLAAARDELIVNAGFGPTSQGPNDGGTISLERTDGDVTLYSVGFVKENFVIVTTWGGLADVTTFPKLLELAGVSSARLDEALAGS